MEYEVKKLISLEAEGGYWDFKEKLSRASAARSSEAKPETLDGLE